MFRRFFFSWLIWGIHDAFDGEWDKICPEETWLHKMIRRAAVWLAGGER